MVKTSRDKGQTAPSPLAPGDSLDVRTRPGKTKCLDWKKHGFGAFLLKSPIQAHASATLRISQRVVWVNTGCLLEEADRLAMVFEITALEEKVALDRKDVLKFTIERSRPHLGPFRSINQFGDDPHLVALFAHRAFQQRAYS